MYEDINQSLDNGAPVELYLFTRGANVWRFTTGAVSVTHLGHTYEPTAIKRTRLEQSENVFKSGLKLTFLRDNELARQYLGATPDEATSLTLLRGHLTDSDGQFIVAWKGNILSAEADGNYIKINCDSLFASIKRPGIRLVFSHNCRHSLYGDGCNVSERLWEDRVVLTAFDKVTVEMGNLTPNANIVATLNADKKQIENYYTGGVLIIPEHGRRFITVHDEDTLTISRPFLNLGEPPINAMILPGCNRTVANCKGYSNLINFGGFPSIPTANPFETDPFYEGLL